MRVFAASVTQAASAVRVSELSGQADSATLVAERVGVPMQLALRLA
jgi:hypothetical protein